MSYSRRQLYALGEPLGDSVTQKKLGGGYIAGFGGGSSTPAAQPSSMSQTTSNIPDWAIPYATKNLGQAAALTDINQNPYQQYQGQRVADFSPLQTQSFNNIQSMQTSPQLGQATGFAGMSGLGSLNAGQNYQNQATNPYAMQAYMSPYQQNVTDFQKQQAINDYGRQLPGMGAAAVGKGAFGGSRQAIVESEAQRNLQNNLTGIQAAGTQNAFQNAQQAQQFGANLGLQGMNQANQAANTLGQIGAQDYAQRMGINSAQQQAGAQQQAQGQQVLSTQYQDFLNQQNYPYKQLAFMSDIMHGVPTSGGSSSMYTAPPNTLGMGIGLGTAALNAMGKAGGGIINAYKRGGSVRHFAVGGLTDPSTELAARSPMPPSNTAEALAKFMLPIIQRMHQPEATPGKTTVAEDMAREILSRNQESGLASLPAENLGGDSYNRGGIVAFKGGGTSLEDEAGEGDATPILPPQFKPTIPVDSSSAGKYAELIKTMEADKVRYAPQSMEVIAAANKAERERAGITGQVGDLRQAQLEKDRSEEDARKDQASKNFWVSAGLNMAAEASRRGNPVSGLAAILQPLSVGADKAMPGYLAEQEKLKSLTEARNKEMGDIANSRRAEAAGLVTLNQATKDKQDARIEKIDAAMLTVQGKVADSVAAREASLAGRATPDMVNYGRTYLASRLNAGDKRDQATILNEGYAQYVEKNRSYPVGFAGIDQRAAASGEDIRVKEAEQERKDNALAETQAAETFKGTGMLPLIKAQTLDRENAAANKKDGTNLPTNNEAVLRQKAVDEARGRIRREGAATKSPAAPKSAAPAGAPKDAKLAPDGNWYSKNTNGQYVRWD